MKKSTLAVSQVGCTTDADVKSRQRSSDSQVPSHYNAPTIKTEPDIDLKDEPAFFDAEDMPAGHMPGSELNGMVDGCRTIKTSSPENSAASVLRLEVSNVQSEVASGQSNNNGSATVGFQLVSKSRYSKIFRCDTCAKDFRTERSVRNHLATHSTAEVGSTQTTDSASNSINTEGSIVGRPAVNAMSSEVEKYIALKNDAVRRQNPLCDVCGMAFCSWETLQKHISDQGGRESFQCSICPRSFALRCGLTSHNREHLPTPACYCCLCQAVFYDLHHLVIHCVQRHSKIERFNCDLCGKEFPQSRRFRLGCSNGVGGRSGCHICGETFALKSLLLAHRHSTDVEAGPFSCDICEKSYSKRSTLEQHYRMHSGSGPYSCDEHEGGSEGATPKSSRVTVRKRSVSPHQCHSCGKTFPSIGPMRHHYRSETCEKPFKCDVCEKTFLRERSLKEHRNKHTGERPFKCKLCEKTFRTKAGYYKHVPWHTAEKSHRCAICSKAFREKRALTLHNRLHTGKMMHRCGTCGQTFVLKYSLKRHSCARNERKQFSCETCGKLFSRIAPLRKHRRLHTGELPFRCETCGRRFNDGHVLAVHKKTHVDGNPSSSPST